MFRGAPKITPRHDINLDSIGLTITAAEIDRLKQFDFSQLRDTVAQADPTLLITALETATYAFFTHETFENAQSQIISTIDDVEEQLAAFVDDSDFLARYGDLASFLEPSTRAPEVRPLARSRRGASDNNDFVQTIQKFHDLMGVVNRLQQPNFATTTESPGSRVGGAFPYTW